MSKDAENEQVVKDSQVVFQSGQGSELRATLLRLTRYSAVFEIVTPNSVLRTSEVFGEFRIIIQNRVIYSGRAVSQNLMNAGVTVICEASLDESSWLDLEFSPTATGQGRLGQQFKEFLVEWQKLYRVLPEFKTVMADMQSFLTDLRLWLEQVELGIRSSPSPDRIQLELQAVNELAKPVIQAIDSFVDRFEDIAVRLDAEAAPVHRTYLRRQLHPLLLCSPFAYRTYHKPLGYAGDYEVVDMMLRPPQEGSSLFAKIINVWLLGQAPAEAHRNRVTYLTHRLVDETLRAGLDGKRARVFNLGCGPADEVRRFLREHDVSEQADLTLLDFNGETLVSLQRTLDSIKNQYQRRTPVQLVRKSVHQILKESSRTVTSGPGTQYDFVYCAGLFDYLTDSVCKRLMNYFYDTLAPGGLLLATNVTDILNHSRPFRYSMEYILDWHLIYRDGQAMNKLAPDRAPADAVKVITDDTGVNVFLEIRRPLHE